MRGARARRAAASLALAVLLGASGAAATTVVAKSFTQLCGEADMIFVGSVVGVDSHWANQDQGQGNIETAVTFSDLQWLRGARGDEVTLRFAGGEVDGITEAIGGVPRFRVGERVLLFARDEHAISPIVGFHQGCLGVVRDDSGNEVVVNAEGRPVEGVDASGFQLAERGAPLSRAMPLRALLDSVRACLRGAEAGQ